MGSDVEPLASIPLADVDAAFAMMPALPIWWTRGAAPRPERPVATQRCNVTLERLMELLGQICSRPGGGPTAETPAFLLW